MKVIQIMDNFIVEGGVNSFVYDLCYALKEQGCEVSLIGLLRQGYDSNPEVENLRNAGIRVECIGASSKKGALMHGIGELRRLIKEISNGEQSICNLHLKLSVLMGVLATQGLNNIKCIETYHSLYSRYWLQTKVLSPFITMYIPCSESAKDEFVKRFHPKLNKVVAISNGVNCKKIREMAVRRNENVITAISVGRFTNQKNLHVTAEAFSKIDSKGFVYKIFGDGILKQQIVESAGGSERVKLCGQVSRQTIIEELTNCDIVVMPSLWEGLSIFMLEAMSLGCPMMISDVPSLRNVFGEKPLNAGEGWRLCTWGYLVETTNVKAYSQAMNHFLKHRDLIEKMRVEVEKYASSYSIEETAKSYMKVYMYCLQREN